VEGPRPWQAGSRGRRSGAKLPPLKLKASIAGFHETGGVIVMNVIWSHFIWYTTEDSFIIGVACDKSGGSDA